MLNFLENSTIRRLQHHLISMGVTLLFSVMAVDLAYGVDVPTLYTAEVLLDENADNPRNDAYRAALREVLARVSGSELSSDPELIDELFPVPSAYVTQFRPGDDDTLWVSFDDQAVERVLRSAGQAVWGRERPLTIVWLAVDWGNGEREIIAAGDPEKTGREGRSIDRNRLLRERILEIAEQRGLPLAFPLLDTTDLQSVTFSDIWGGFDDRIVDASQRYEAKSVLIGRVRPSRSQRNRWTYRFGAENRSWTGPPETIVAQIADLLAAEFSVGGDAPLESVVLNIAGVESVDAFGSVQALLAGVSLIEAVKVSAVSGDVVSYEVEIRGGATRLRRALRFTGLLETESSTEFNTAESLPVLEFFYGPKPASESSPNVL